VFTAENGLGLLGGGEAAGEAAQFDQVLEAGFVAQEALEVEQAELVFAEHLFFKGVQGGGHVASLAAGGEGQEFIAQAQGGFDADLDVHLAQQLGQEEAAVGGFLGMEILAGHFVGAVREGAVAEEELEFGFIEGVFVFGAGNGAVVDMVPGFSAAAEHVVAGVGGEVDDEADDHHHDDDGPHPG
jgi:hypothetical protein